MKWIENQLRASGAILAKLFVLILLINMLPTLSVAQGNEKMCLQLGGGISIKEGSEAFKEGWKEGYHGLGNIGIKIGPGFWARAKFQYHKFNCKDFEGKNISGGDFITYLLGLDGVLCRQYPSRNLNPYAFAGFGLSIWTIDTLFEDGRPVQLSVSKEDFYANIGAGIDIRLFESVSAFAEISYMYIYGRDMAFSYIPVSIGIKSYLINEKQVPERWEEEPNSGTTGSPGKFSALFGIGGTFNVDEDDREGIHAMFGVGTEISPSLIFHLNCDHHFLIGDDPGSITVVGVDGRFLFGQINSEGDPYITAGLGYPFVSYADGDFSGNIGAGIEFWVSKKNKPFLQLRYLHLSTDERAKAYVLLEAGIRIRPGHRP
jgi:hypothetical protein